MAKRFTATELWEEDWFLDMTNEYKLFWYYMLSNCDHGGFYRVNVRSFNSLLEVKVSPAEALKLFNAGKQRIREISESVWFVEDFFFFQYGDSFNINSPLHKSVFELYKKHRVDIAYVRGLKEVNLTPKDKDKDKYKDKNDFGKSENLLGPRMVKVFKTAYPEYPVEQETDFTACLKIAYKIAKQNGWKKEAVTNGKLEDAVRIWTDIVIFSKTDSWLNTRCITDFEKEYQRIIQKMNNGKQGTSGVGKTLDFDRN